MGWQGSGCKMARPAGGCGTHPGRASRYRQRRAGRGRAGLPHSVAGSYISYEGLSRAGSASGARVMPSYPAAARLACLSLKSARQCRDSNGTCDTDPVGLFVGRRQCTTASGARSHRRVQLDAGAPLCAPVSIRGPAECAAGRCMASRKQQRLHTTQAAARMHNPCVRLLRPVRQPGATSLSTPPSHGLPASPGSGTPPMTSTRPSGRVKGVGYHRAELMRCLLTERLEFS